MGEKTVTSRRHLRRRHQRCATPKRNPLQAPTTPELLHHGIVVHELHMPDRRSFRSKEASAHTPATALGMPIEPGHSAWGPRLTHRLTLSAKDSRNNRREESISSTLPSLKSPPQQAQQRKSSSTPTATRTNAHPAAPLASSATTTSDGTPNTTPSRRLRRPGAAVARPEGRGFHPESPPQREDSASP
jgi:hypothetical protein